MFEIIDILNQLSDIVWGCVSMDIQYTLNTILEGKQYPSYIEKSIKEIKKGTRVDGFAL